MKALVFHSVYVVAVFICTYALSLSIRLLVQDVLLRPGVGSLMGHKLESSGVRTTIYTNVLPNQS